MEVSMVLWSVINMKKCIECEVFELIEFDENTFAKCKKCPVKYQISLGPFCEIYHFVNEHKIIKFVVDNDIAKPLINNNTFAELVEIQYTPQSTIISNASKSREVSNIKYIKL